jgi:hypothetical protein
MSEPKSVEIIQAELNAGSLEEVQALELALVWRGYWLERKREAWERAAQINADTAEKIRAGYEASHPVPQYGRGQFLGYSVVLSERDETKTEKEELKNCETAISTADAFIQAFQNNIDRLKNPPPAPPRINFQGGLKELAVWLADQEGKIDHLGDKTVAALFSCRGKPVNPDSLKVTRNQ